MTRKLLGLLLLLLAISGTVAAMHGSASGSAQSACQVQGVWRQERVATNGKVDSTSGQEAKIMTKSHFMWTSQESRRDTLPMKTYRDSVRALSNGGGYGTYTVSGSNLTEHIELFPTPSWTGRAFHATCRTDRNHWVHTWITDTYKDSTGRSRRDTIVEYYRRVE